MLSLEHGINRDNYCKDITHEQPINKQISYRSYKRIASLFDFENIYYERKAKLALYKLGEY